MGLFDFFKKKAELTESQIKWTKLWELWAQGLVGSPCAELMTYQGEVNNGGHYQYFSNVENTDDLQAALAALETVLPAKLKSNLQTAYKSYLASEENDDEAAEEIIAHCDDVFYENEDEINRILEGFAAEIEL